MDEIETKGVFRRAKSGISGHNKIESIVSNVLRGRSLWTKLKRKACFVERNWCRGKEKEEIIKSCRSFRFRVEREKHLGRSLPAKLKERISYIPTGGGKSCCIFLE